MLDLLCPKGVPQWYQVVRDLTPLIAAIIALFAAGVAYRGVLVKIRADRADRARDRIANGLALIHEINFHAYPLAGMVEHIFKWQSETGLFDHFRALGFLGYDDVVTAVKRTCDEGWQRLSDVDQYRRADLAKRLGRLENLLIDLARLSAFMMQGTKFDDESKLSTLYLIAAKMNTTLRAIDQKLAFDPRLISFPNIFESVMAELGREDMADLFPPTTQ